MPVKILLVDDEELFAKGVAKSLEHEGYQVTVAHDGEIAREKFKVGDHDLVVLDIMLPGVDGLTLCREFRSMSEIPIIMLSARGEDIDKIIGLEMGADDYLAKPFNVRELTARIKAIMRRSNHNSGAKKTITKGELIIDASRRKVTVQGKEVDLTAKEYELLMHLASAPGRIYTRDQLLEQVWGYDYLGEDRTVDVHVRRLREKIETDPGKPTHVLTKWGVGYFFNDEE